ncbi:MULTISPECIES: tetratricopeptide repeat protein [Anaeromyxobacter]|uniref:tetratricopeptide repeat protein n=1 Tax=Anaeromyxobacter TaxID=161492 RepID=UPI001F59A1E2|nr:MULTISPECIES: tetratricopeptide repeat protein [unclassified Anaeromyxobacter]
MTRSLALVLLAAAALGCAHRPSGKQRRTAEIHHDLAVEAFRGGRAPDALREYDAALAVDPGFAEAHRGRGLVLDFGFGRLDEAERAYRRALELRPEYPETHNDLGQLLARTGRYDEALREFDLALGDMTYREPYVARCNKGQALWRMGRREEGHAELRACLSLAPSYCKGRRDLGRIFLEEGKMTEAVEELGAYARSCEKTPDAHLQLGLARMRAGDLPGARTAFERCAELAPSSADGEECRRSLTLLGE